MALYALLVGIDAYEAPVQRLNGARNDIAAAQAFLAGSVPPDAYFPLCLLDEDATRAAVVDGFRDHLGRAGAGDSAVFWFCGHGSQAPPPDEAAHLVRLEPGRMLQTVLCVDSRHDGTADLYDKELATLIAEVAARGVHLVAVMDCCHSDSSTRAGGDAAAGPGDGLLTARWQPAPDHTTIGQCPAGAVDAVRRDRARPRGTGGRGRLRCGPPVPAPGTTVSGRTATRPSTAARVCRCAARSSGTPATSGSRWKPARTRAGGSSRASPARPSGTSTSRAWSECWSPATRWSRWTGGPRTPSGSRRWPGTGPASPRSSGTPRPPSCATGWRACCGCR
ncbi:hypothetical protein G3I60_02390 [Streptomyces sp. SID13666]|nr:hypothetical protein [Streptomyces sp. SID13666]NEA69619.1 hypothetical protein [Streptomyces sp. SID13588]